MVLVFISIEFVIVVGYYVVGALYLLEGKAKIIAKKLCDRFAKNGAEV